MLLITKNIKGWTCFMLCGLIPIGARSGRSYRNFGSEHGSLALRSANGIARLYTRTVETSRMFQILNPPPGGRTKISFKHADRLRRQGRAEFVGTRAVRLLFSAGREFRAELDFARRGQNHILDGLWPNPNDSMTLWQIHGLPMRSGNRMYPAVPLRCA
jgi:hypothetical protein